MVVGPSSRSVATPNGETVATVVTDEVHVALGVMLPLLPSEKVPVAVNCCAAPTGIETLCGAITSDVRVRTFCVSAEEVLPA